MDRNAQFGIDYLELMDGLNNAVNNQDPVGWACIKMFLTEWGFDLQEILNILALYDKRVKAVKMMSKAELLKLGNDSMSSATTIERIG